MRPPRRAPLHPNPQQRRRTLENAIREGPESGSSPRKGADVMKAAKARLGRG